MNGCLYCGSDDLAIRLYDFGVCPETGYHDAGERWVCRVCGAEGDVEELENMKAFIATDGSGTTSGPGGWAAVLRFGDQVREISGGIPEATNNIAELTAAIMALSTLKRPCEIVLKTDSEYLLKGITERIAKWKRFGWQTFEGQPVKNRDLWEELDRQAARHKIEWVHVKGHSGDPDNERADELAGAERKKLLGEEPAPKKRITLEKVVADIAKLSNEERLRLREMIGAA